MVFNVNSANGVDQLTNININDKTPAIKILDIKIKRLALGIIAATVVSGILAMHPIVAIPYSFAIVGVCAVGLAVSTLAAVRQLNRLWDERSFVIKQLSRQNPLNLTTLSTALQAQLITQEEADFYLERDRQRNGERVSAPVVLPAGLNSIQVLKTVQARILWNYEAFFWGARRATLPDYDCRKLQREKFEAYLEKKNSSSQNPEDIDALQRLENEIFSSFFEWDPNAKPLSRMKVNGTPLVLKREDMMIPVFFDNVRGKIPCIPYLPFRLFFDGEDFSKPLQQNQTIEFTYLPEEGGDEILVTLTLSDNFHPWIEELEKNAAKSGTKQRIPLDLARDSSLQTRFQKSSMDGIYPPVAHMAAMRGDHLPKISSAGLISDSNYWGFSFFWSGSKKEMIELSFNETNGRTTCKINASRDEDRQGNCSVGNLQNVPLDSELGRMIHPEVFTTEIILPEDVHAQPELTYQDGVVRVIFPFR